jgi:hypothetical protein
VKGPPSGIFFGGVVFSSSSSSSLCGEDDEDEDEDEEALDGHPAEFTRRGFLFAKGEG